MFDVNATGDIMLFHMTFGWRCWRVPAKAFASSDRLARAGHWWQMSARHYGRNEKESDAVNDSVCGDTSHNVVGESKEQRENQRFDEHRDQVGKPPGGVSKRECGYSQNTRQPNAAE
ncbi:MAG: hypothetical protein ABI748_01560 [Dokdonella sp.]